MIFVISPSKTQDFSASEIKKYSTARQLAQSQELIDTLVDLNPEELSKLMKISDKLSQLNWQRYQDFQLPFNLSNAKQALLAFKGDVYAGIDVENYTKEDFEFAQQHLRILSGLYGVLRPLDLIQPYRLEMGTRLENPRGKNLYAFWGGKITELLNQDLAEDKTPLLVNLASNEYYKSVQTQILKTPVLTIVFKERKGNVYKVIAIHAKRARGLMVHFAIKNRITKPENLKEFSLENYFFNQELSTDSEWVFCR